MQTSDRMHKSNTSKCNRSNDQLLRLKNTEFKERSHRTNWSPLISSHLNWTELGRVRWDEMKDVNVALDGNYSSQTHRTSAYKQHGRTATYKALRNIAFSGCKLEGHSWSLEIAVYHLL